MESDKQTYCGPICPYFEPGDGAGTRRCQQGFWDEKLPHKLPRLNEELRVMRACARIGRHGAGHKR